MGGRWPYYPVAFPFRTEAYIRRSIPSLLVYSVPRPSSQSATLTIQRSSVRTRACTIVRIRSYRHPIYVPYEDDWVPAPGTKWRRAGIGLDRSL